MAKWGAEFKSSGHRPRHAIGTWKNLYGRGQEAPLDRVDRRGEQVVGTGKKAGAST